MHLAAPPRPGDAAGSAARQPFDVWFVGAWPRAFRLAAFLTHDLQAGEDIAQDVLSEMARRWDRLDSPDAYLQRAVSNASWNWKRRRHTADRKLPLLASAGCVLPAAEAPVFDELADAVARLTSLDDRRPRRRLLAAAAWRSTAIRVTTGTPRSS